MDLFCVPLEEKTQLTRYSKYSMFKANHKREKKKTKIAALAK